MKQLIQLKVNGQFYDVVVRPEDLLIDVLRQKLGLIGTKKGCGQGDCGTCTVLIDGKRVLSCITLAISCQGKAIETIEGVENAGRLDTVQEAFLEKGAVQCGFCTPGMIMSTKALLNENPNPSRDDIKRGLSGNLCRCTGYIKIFDAVEEAAKRQNTAAASQKGEQ